MKFASLSSLTDFRHEGNLSLALSFLTPPHTPLNDRYSAHHAPNEWGPLWPSVLAAPLALILLEFLIQPVRPCVF